MIDSLTHSEMERTEHEEVNFPLLIPENLLDKENALVARLRTKKRAWTLMTSEMRKKKVDSRKSILG